MADLSENAMNTHPVERVEGADPVTSTLIITSKTLRALINATDHLAIPLSFGAELTDRESASDLAAEL